MDKARQNIILGRLSALTGIIMDIFNYCQLDAESQDVIAKNLSSIKSILELASVSTADNVEVSKKYLQLVKIPPPTQRVTRQVTRQAEKRKQAEKRNPSWQSKKI
ncbi:hypothetical protein ACFFRR_009631 [Megaselia abdita]